MKPKTAPDPSEEEAFSVLRQALEGIARLTEPEWTSFAGICRLKKLATGEALLEQGQVSHSSAFLVKGVCRHYAMDEDGRETIYELSLDPCFLANCDSYLSQTPSACSIQAIEPSHLLVFRNRELEMLCDKHPNLQKIGKLVVQSTLAGFKEHMMLLLRLSPQRRYDYLLEHRPELIQKVSVTHLAQFLGLSRETVSRLRHKLIM